MNTSLAPLLTAAACLWIASCGSASSKVVTSAATTPDAAGLVDITRLIPDAALDIRYAGSDNFVGAPVDGYEAPKCYLLAPVADALARVEQALRKDNLRLQLFDCYRPVRAVKHFVRWAEDLSDQRTKARHYPDVDKSSLLGLYISRSSGHSRGATIDLGLLSCDEQGKTCTPVDMGTPFDFFDELARTASPAVSDQQRTNRRRLVDAMRREGFENYVEEWWHYTYRPEPTPDLAYDVPVK